MNTHFAVFFTIAFLSLTAFAEVEVTAPAPAEKAGEKTNKAIVKQELETGETRSYSLESSYRNESTYPSNWGEAGIFRIRSAESFPKGTVTFGIGGEFYAINDAPDFGVGSRSAKTIAESLFVGYTPIDKLSLSLMRRSSSTTFGEPQQLISSLGDLNFSAMYSVPLNQSWAIAPLFDFLIASNFNQLNPEGSTISAGMGAAATFNLFPSAGIPLVTHANVVYHMPQIRQSGPALVAPETFFNFSRYHTVTLGLGAEYKLGDIIPFLEFQENIETNSPLSFGNSPSKISFGARFTPLANKSLAVLLGTDIALSRGLAAGVPFTPGYQVIGQLSYTVGLNQTERKHYYTTTDVNVVDRRFVISKNINFKVGSAILENSSYEVLNQIAKVIKENNIKKLLIVGHTDSSASDEFNLKLSQDRAQSVKTYLISQGVGEEVLMPQGYGKRKPKASNSTETGRSINRRVEFIVVE